MTNYILYDAIKDLADIVQGLFWNNIYFGTSGIPVLWSNVADADISEPANYYSGGTVWFPPITTASGSGINVSTSINSGATSGSQIPFDTFQAYITASSGSGVYYIADGKVPRYVLINSINAALQEIGPFVFTKNYTVTEDTEEYTVPENVFAVEQSADDAVPYGWDNNYFWHLTSGSSVTGQQLSFDKGKEPGTAGYFFRVYYLDNHPRVSNDTDVIHQDVNKERLRWTAAVYAWRWRFQRANKEDPGLVEMLNDAKSMAEQMARKYPIRRPERIHLSSV